MKKIFIIGLIFLCLSGCGDSEKKVKGLGASVTHLNTQIESVQADAEPVIVAVRDAEIDDLIELLQVGVQASSPFNPYAIPISAGLGLLSAGLAFFAKKKDKEVKGIKSDLSWEKQMVKSADANRKENFTALEEIVSGLEQIEKTSEFKDRQLASQSIRTQELVSCIRRNLKV